MGVFVGTLIGVLPGIGPVGTMSLLLPATFHLSPVGAIIMLAGIYYGAQYGGSTTSILVNIPGEASSIVTCLDGYQMARQGRAGPALGMSALGSFIGGLIAIAGLMLLAVPLAEAALSFGPPEYFALMCVSLVVLTFLSQASMYKSLNAGLKKRDVRGLAFTSLSNRDDSPYVAEQLGFELDTSRRRASPSSSRRSSSPRACGCSLSWWAVVSRPSRSACGSPRCSSRRQEPSSSFRSSARRRLVSARKSR